jgi:hypothetical protein
MSTHSRSTGLATMGVGLGLFAGTNAQMLPAGVFFPALLLCCVGIFIFVRANRVATDEAEERTRRALNPELHNQTMERFAERQAKTDGRLLEALGSREERATAAEAVATHQVNEDEIVLYEVDDESTTSGADDLMVTTDVSFPLEVQEQSSLADQIQKLQRLQEQEIISSEEFAIAKAKLLK